MIQRFHSQTSTIYCKRATGIEQYASACWPAGVAQLGLIIERPDASVQEVGLPSGYFWLLALDQQTPILQNTHTHKHTHKQGVRSLLETAVRWFRVSSTRADVPNSTRRLKRGGLQKIAEAYTCDHHNAESLSKTGGKGPVAQFARRRRLRQSLQRQLRGLVHQSLFAASPAHQNVFEIRQPIIQARQVHVVKAIICSRELGELAHSGFGNYWQ